MTQNTPSAHTRPSGLYWLILAFRFALRELRGGLSGFYVFAACIALGTAAIGSVNAISAAMTESIRGEGQSILGGDIRFELVHRETTPDEQAFLDDAGTVTHIANIRSMARRSDQADQALVEIKAVDSAYPLYGAFETAPALTADAMQTPHDRDGQMLWPVAVQPLLLDRLNVSIGDILRIGNAQVQIDATIIREPDALSDGIGLAPRVIMARTALEASDLIQPGSLVEHAYKIALPDGTTDAGIEVLTQRAAETFPEAGWSVRSRANAAPALASNIERFAQFLTLVGLTALVTGGVGVANAVRAFLDSKRSVIATMKCLGAPGGFVSLVYLFQILAVASIAIAFGLILAIIAPVGATWALSNVLPVSNAPGLYPGALALAALFSFLTVIIFALIPLGRARNIPASSLFRDLQLAGLGQSPLIYGAGAGAAALILADRRIALAFLGAVTVSFIVLRLVATAIQVLASRQTGIRKTGLRMAVANIHRPGALTPSVVIALGLGLTLLVALSLVDGNLRKQISGNLSREAPNFFFVDIQSTLVDAFAERVEQTAGDDAKLIRVPMLRGRIVELNGLDVREIDMPPEGAWVLRGDRGITYAQNVPENSTLVAGEWWDANHDGEPLVSFSAEEAVEIGMEIGDTITVNVLGRNITARIANLREVAWESLAINFVMVFSPNTFAGAPHSWLATLSMPDATADDERDILNAVTRAFPAVTTVRVKDALDVVNRVVGQLATAIRVAAAVALIASILVLAGALAAGNRARIHDSVVLKTLGATRTMLIGSFVMEYAILGLVTALFALLAGGIAAWFVISVIMTLPWTLFPSVALTTVVIALIFTIGFGMIGTWRVLGHKAAPVLRNL